MDEPTDNQVIEAWLALLKSGRNLGRAKALATLRAGNDWDLGSKRFKQLIAAASARQNVGDATEDDAAAGAGQHLDTSNTAFTPIVLPKDPHAALLRCIAEGRWRFKIYGRGQYDYGVDMPVEQRVAFEVSSKEVQAGPELKELARLLSNASPN